MQLLGNCDDPIERQLCGTKLLKPASIGIVANFHATAKALGIDVNYKRVLKEFESRVELFIIAMELAKQIDEMVLFWGTVTFAS